MDTYLGANAAAAARLQQSAVLVAATADGARVHDADAARLSAVAESATLSTTDGDAPTTTAAATAHATAAWKSAVGFFGTF